jgi:predicted membrane protein
METEKDYLFKRGRNRGGKGVGFALFLILLGGIFLFLNLGIIPEMYRPLLISWKTLLIVIGLWTLIVKREYTGGVILIAIGTFFLYPTLCAVFPEYFVRFDIDIRTYWPVILIIIGVTLVIGWLFPHRKSEHRKHRWETETRNTKDGYEQFTDYIDKNVMFGSSEQIILSANFQGGEANVMFGELIVDLRKAKLAEGEYILQLNAAFGSVVLYVPSEWYIETRTNTFLGSFDDKRRQNMEIINSTSKLIIKGSAAFASGEIRN